MTKEEFRELKPGDVVYYLARKGDWTDVYVQRATYVGLDRHGNVKNLTLVHSDAFTAIHIGLNLIERSPQAVCDRWVEQIREEAAVRLAAAERLLARRAYWGIDP